MVLYKQQHKKHWSNNDVMTWSWYTLFSSSFFLHSFAFRIQFKNWRISTYFFFTRFRFIDLFLAKAYSKKIYVLFNSHLHEMVLWALRELQSLAAFLKRVCPPVCCNGQNTKAESYFYFKFIKTTGINANKII